MPGSRGRARTLQSLRLTSQINRPLESHNATLDDIQLDASGENGPEGLKELTIVVGKCVVLGTYAVLTAGEIGALLTKTGKEMPPLIPDSEGCVLVSSVQRGPTKFYLRWKEQAGPLLLLNGWLSDSVREKKLDRFFKEADLADSTLDEIKTAMKGEWVVAPRYYLTNPTKVMLYARGVFKGFESNSNDESGDFPLAVIYFVDYGDEGLSELASLYSIPPELEGLSLGPLCFKAHLCNFSRRMENQALAVEVENEFFKILNLNIDLDLDEQQDEQRELHCIIKNSADFEDFGSGSSGPGEISVVELLLKSEHGVLKDSILKVSEELKNNLSTLKRNVRRNARRQSEAAAFNIQLTVNENNSSEEMNVQPFTDTDHSTLKLFRVVHSISPNEFQLMYVPNAESVIGWKNEMQTKYESEEWGSYYTIKDDLLVRNRCYAWYDRRDKTWNRVRMIQPSMPSKKVSLSTIWDIDRGCRSYANVADLRVLDRKFYTAEALATKAHLVHIQPRDGANKWSTEARKKFESLCMPDKVFYTLILEERKETFKENPYSDYDGNIPSFGVLLAEKSEEPNGTVQSALVRAHMADATGPVTGAYNLADYTIDNSLLAPYNTKDMRVALQIEDPPEKLAKKQILNVYDDLNSTFHSINLNRGFEYVPHIPEVMRTKMGAVVITYAGTGIDNFYIRMLNKIAEFHHMTHDLATVANHLAVVPLNGVKPGDFALARALDEQTYDYWARVMVLSVDVSAKSAKALFVDYGFVLLIRMDTVREMPRYFRNIPGFCHRVHLDLSEVNDDYIPKEKKLILSGFTKWTVLANGAWQRYINSWQDQSPAYQAWQGQLSSVIKLQEFNQGLLFNQISMTWSAGKLMKKRAYAVMNQKRQDPLLQHFYSSIGISLMYELAPTSPRQFFAFATMITFLEKLGFVKNPSEGGGDSSPGEQSDL